MKRKNDRRRYPMQPIVKPAVGRFIVSSISVNRPAIPSGLGAGFVHYTPGLTSVTLTLESSGPVDVRALCGQMVIVRPL